MLTKFFTLLQEAFPTDIGNHCITLDKETDILTLTLNINGILYPFYLDDEAELEMPKKLIREIKAILAGKQ